MKWSGRILIAFGLLLLIGFSLDRFSSWGNSRDENGGFKSGSNHKSSPHLQRSKKKHADQPRQDSRFESGVLELRKLASTPTELREEKTFFSGQKIRSSEGNVVTLSSKGLPEVLKVVRSPSSAEFIVCRGAPPSWSIYDEEGELVRELPSVSELDSKKKANASIQWSWFNDESLIAEVEYYDCENSGLPQYPEEDGVPLEVVLLKYEVLSGVISRIELPENSSRGLIRFEGISSDGYLVISITDRKFDYWGPRKENEISCYMMPHAP